MTMGFMSRGAEQPPADDDVSENQSRTTELRRMIQERVRKLRQIVEKLRRRLH